jgi:Uma2 family endonuclease
MFVLPKGLPRRSRRTTEIHGGAICGDTHFTWSPRVSRLPCTCVVLRVLRGKIGRSTSPRRRVFFPEPASQIPSQYLTILLFASIHWSRLLVTITAVRATNLSLNDVGMAASDPSRTRVSPSKGPERPTRKHSKYGFDGFRPIAMAPAAVGHNRIGRNIRETIRPRLPAGTPCDTYGPQDAIETVGGALREPDAFIACSRPHRTAVAVPAPIVVFEVVSPGPANRRGDEEKIDEYESAPSILRYVVVESENRSFRAFWREPGEQAWHREVSDTAGAIRLPEFGIDLTLDEVYAGVDFD